MGIPSDGQSGWGEDKWVGHWHTDSIKEWSGKVFADTQQQPTSEKDASISGAQATEAQRISAVQARIAQAYPTGQAGIDAERSSEAQEATWQAEVAKRSRAERISAVQARIVAELLRDQSTSERQRDDGRGR